MSYTREQRRAICRAWKALTWLDERMESLVGDPMTAAMGCPVGDFAEAWGREARSMQARALNELQRLRVAGRLQDDLVCRLTAHI